MLRLPSVSPFSLVKCRETNTKGKKKIHWQLGRGVLCRRPYFLSILVSVSLCLSLSLSVCLSLQIKVILSTDAKALGLFQLDVSTLSAFLNSKYTSTDLCSFGVWTWESGLGSPDSGGLEDWRTGEREDGLSAIGTAADLMTSSHQLFLLLGLL